MLGERVGLRRRQRRRQRHAGTAQPVDFIATDILRISDGRITGGRITDNWHIEDNLTFLRQIGAVGP